MDKVSKILDSLMCLIKRQNRMMFIMPSELMYSQIKTIGFLIISFKWIFSNYFRLRTNWQWKNLYDGWSVIKI